MKQVHRADTRGVSENNWLYSQHSFSFADYIVPERNGLGKLRVLNDDIVQAGQGFGFHHHKNMEIISIPLSGELQHKDTLGNEHVIKTGDIQIMSAGSGIDHSEYNPSSDTIVNFLQIWILPKTLDIEPRYAQLSYDQTKMNNHFLAIVSPFSTDVDSVPIEQNSILSLANIDEGVSLNYNTHFESASCYFFIIEGEVEFAGERLKKRDAIALTDITTITIIAKKTSKLLCIETT